MGSDTPRVLVWATFFVVELHTCLRDSEEHRSLRFSNFSCYSSPERWVYVENCSENRQGHLSHLLHKEVLIYQCPDTGNRCPVKILDEYHARVPPAATEEDAAFYLCPLPGTPVANVCFAKQPIGKQPLTYQSSYLLRPSAPTKASNHVKTFQNLDFQQCICCCHVSSLHWLE